MIFLQGYSIHYQIHDSRKLLHISDLNRNEHCEVVVSYNFQQIGPHKDHTLHKEDGYYSVELKKESKYRLDQLRIYFLMYLILFYEITC
jgi:hypothetical protein